MRPLFVCVVLCASLATAAAPPAKVPPEWLKLIDQLGDENEETWKSAEKKLADLGENAIFALRKSAREHADPDVRLRATVLALAIEKKVYGEVRRFTGSKDGVVAFAISPDGKRMVSGCWEVNERVARVWDMKTGKELFQLKGHTSAIACLDWSGDNKQILTGGVDRSIRLWDSSNGKMLKTIPNAHDLHLHAVLFTPDGKKAVSCGYDRSIVVWDLATEKVHKRIDVHSSVVRGLAWMPRGKQIATASFDRTVRIIDIETGKEVRKMVGEHPGAAWFVAVSPDGKRIASSGADGMVRLWDSGTGKQLAVFKGHTQGVHGIAYSRDGKRLLSAGSDNSARLWSIDLGKEIQHIEAPARVTCVAFSPDDGHAIFSCYDKTVKIWKIRK
jgi:WD40 repeat protein